MYLLFFFFFKGRSGLVSCQCLGPTRVLMQFCPRGGEARSGWGAGTADKILPLPALCQSPCPGCPAPGETVSPYYSPGPYSPELQGLVAGVDEGEGWLWFCLPLYSLSVCSVHVCLSARRPTSVVLPPTPVPLASDSGGWGLEPG